MSAPGANDSAYCKYDNQGLQAFTSVLFLVRNHLFSPSLSAPFRAVLRCPSLPILSDWQGLHTTMHARLAASPAQI